MTGYAPTRVNPLQVFCEDHPNSHLAYVTTADENAFIKGMIAANLSRGPCSHFV